MWSTLAMDIPKFKRDASEWRQIRSGHRGLIYSVQDIDAYWEHLHGADALIFGTPTYMGTVSG